MKSRDDLCTASQFRFLVVYLEFKCSAFSFESTYRQLLNAKRFGAAGEKRSFPINLVWFQFHHKSHGYNTMPGIKLKKVDILGNTAVNVLSLSLDILRK